MSRPLGNDEGGNRYVGWRDLTVWKSTAGRFAAMLAHRAARWIGPYPVLVVTLLLALVAAVTLTAASVEIYQAVAEADGVAGLDRPVLLWAVTARTPQLNTVVTAFTNLGGPVGATLFAALMAFSRVYLGHHRLTDVVVAWTLGLAWLTIIIMAHRLYLTVRHAHPEAAAPAASGRGTDE